MDESIHSSTHEGPPRPGGKKVPHFSEPNIFEVLEELCESILGVPGLGPFTLEHEALGKYKLALPSWQPGEFYGSDKEEFERCLKRAFGPLKTSGEPPWVVLKGERVIKDSNGAISYTIRLVWDDAFTCTRVGERPLTPKEKEQHTTATSNNLEHDLARLVGKSFAIFYSPTRPIYDCKPKGR